MDLVIFLYNQYASDAKYTGKQRIVVIPQSYKGVPVTEIRSNAFAHNEYSKRVFIPSTLNFKECKGGGRNGQPESIH